MVLLVRVSVGILGTVLFRDARTFQTQTAYPSTSSTSAKPTPSQAAVRVYNIFAIAGLGQRTADQLKAAGFTATSVGNLSFSDVSATTVYYTDADGEHATADAVGQTLGARVQPRIAALSDQPPGVIVVLVG